MPGGVAGDGAALNADSAAGFEIDAAAKRGAGEDAVDAAERIARGVVGNGAAVERQAAAVFKADATAAHSGEVAADPAAAHHQQAAVFKADAAAKCVMVFDGCLVIADFAVGNAYRAA